MLRRLVALVLMLCFGLFTAEALLADVHDGDATHEELVRVDGDQHATEHAITGAGADELPGERAPDEQGHSEHACHCVHAHGAWSPVQALLFTATVAVESRQPALHVDGPTNPAPEPRLRPPIA
jgi:hypothetical protein